MGSSGEETSSPQNRLAQRRGSELVLVGADGPEVRNISRHCDIVADDGLDGDRNLNGRVDTATSLPDALVNILARKHGVELTRPTAATAPDRDIVADDSLDGDRNLNGRVDIRPLADNPEIRGLSQSTRAQGKSGHTCKKQRF